MYSGSWQYSFVTSGHIPRTSPPPLWRKLQGVSGTRFLQPPRGGGGGSKKRSEHRCFPYPSWVWAGFGLFRMGSDCLNYSGGASNKVDSEQRRSHRFLENTRGETKKSDHEVRVEIGGSKEGFYYWFLGFARVYFASGQSGEGNVVGFKKIHSIERDGLDLLLYP